MAGYKLEKMMGGGGKKRRRKKRKGALPSEKANLTPEKAGVILSHGEVRGHKLTKKQRGLMGAIRGKKRS